MINDLSNTNWINIQNGLEKYLRIMQFVKTSNVQNDKEFQKLFNGFYKIIKRSKEFYEALYGYLEEQKEKEISFEQTLSFFYQKFQRLEPSFSSKIVATINPNFPVWDSEVLARLDLVAPSFSLDKNMRFEKIVKTYDEIIHWYSEFLNTEEAKNMIKVFDEKNGISNITNLKKIDLILWQTRS